MLFFAEGLGLFGEFEAFFGESELRSGHFFAEGVHLEFLGGYLLVEFEALLANFGASREIGQALEGEELVRGIAAGADGLQGFEKDGVVDLLGSRCIAFGNGVEGGEGEFFAAGDPGVDLLDCFLSGPEAFEGAIRTNVKSEAAFGAGLVHADAECGIGFAVEQLGDLLDLGVGEGGEGGLASLFSHKSAVEKGGIKGL